MRRLLVAAACLVLAGPVVFGFGQNKVQYEQFNWQFIQTRNFRIFYYRDGAALAEFVATHAERHYQRLSRQWHYRLKRNKRLPIIVYNSHNHFKQTNIILELLEDEVGGFTELFKNRVVIPYQGSYEELRHVLEHELTHAIMFDMVFGSSLLETLYNLQNMISLPLWFIEGLAEYASLDWDVESDAVLRDAIINDQLRSIDEVGGFLIYKGGQSLVRYIARTYGDDKLGAIIKTIRLNKNLDKALKSVIGVDKEELSKRWLKELKKDYWPEVGRRTDPEEIGSQFTFHDKDGSHFNVAPSFCPKGDKIVYLSDRRDYIDIYLMSAIDGKVMDRLVEGERTRQFESMNWLKSRIACAPDNRRIAFVAQSGGRDVMYIYNRKTKKKVREFSLKFDGLQHPAWNPAGEQIAFSGISKGRSDLYVLDLRKGSVARLTDDYYDDIQPAWSYDGNRLAFVSDRPPDPAPDTVSTGRRYPARFGTYNIFIYTLGDSLIAPVTRTDYNNLSPSWHPDGDRLVYVSSYNGVSNLFVSDFRDSTTYPLTNTLSSCHAPHWSPDGKKIIFTQFLQGGWDIFMLRNVDQHRLKMEDIAPTAFTTGLEPVIAGGKFKPEPDSLIPVRPGLPADSADAEVSTPPEKVIPETTTVADVQAVDSVFGNIVAGSTTADSADSQARAAGDSMAADTAKQLVLTPKDYQLEFSPDYMSIQFYLSSLYLASGFIYLTLSDIMGNHRFLIFLKSYQIDIQNVDFNVLYFYLPQRVDIGGGLFRELNYYAVNDTTFYTDNFFGGSGILSYPFNKFNRLDLGVDALKISRKTIKFTYGSDDQEVTTQAREVVQPYLDLVHDNVIWGVTGPVNGQRARLLFLYSPDVSAHSLDFKTIIADTRKYLRWQKKYNFVLRLSAGSSFGQDRQDFYLGGTRNCLFGPGITAGVADEQLWSLENFYFGNYVAPLRGTKFYDLRGKGFLLTNVEFRYPFISYLVVDWPLGLVLRSLRGALFMDAATVWDTFPAWKGFRFTGGIPRHDDLNTKCGIGFGGRLNVGFTVLRLDIAWQTDFNSIAAKPHYYFSLGGEF